MPLSAVDATDMSPPALVPIAHCQEYPSNAEDHPDISNQKPSPRQFPTPPLHLRIPLIQASALVAESVTFPVDFVKTRMQVHNTGNVRFSTVLVSTVRQHGIWEIYKGIQPAVIRHCKSDCHNVFCSYDD